MILTVLDALGIQDYIFTSNRLKDNIGASELVDAALSRWPIEILQLVFQRVNPAQGYNPDASQSLLEGAPLDAELFYAGGGVAVLLFPDLCHAKKFARAYSLKVLRDAPGFRAECVHYEFEKDLATALEEALIRLAQHKADCEPGGPLPGLGVSLPCAITRRPANRLIKPSEDEDEQPVATEIEDEDEQPVATEIAVKRSPEAINRAKKRIKNLVPELDREVELSEGQKIGPFDFPPEFDKMGRTEGESSYIGVVHIDGNGMGERISELAGEHKDAGKSRSYLDAMRSFSSDITQAGNTAVRELMNFLIHESIAPAEKGKWMMAQTVDIERYKKGSWLLPMRFLVYGGDDITFVCDGRLALDLTAHMLKTFQELKLPSFTDQALTACAGIAIVKTHYPFSRAYQMAETLCHSAKLFIADEMRGKAACVLDWHITAGGVQTDISAIRARDYELGDGTRLTSRPYVIPGDGLDIPTGHSWDWFRNTILDGMIDPAGDWVKHRTKLKDPLARALRGGKEMTSVELAKLAKKELTLPGGDPWDKEGFHYGKTPYMDALELIDMVPFSRYWSREGRVS